MKVTNSKDGVKRATLNITFRVSLNDIVEQFVAYHRGPCAIEHAKNDTKKEIIKAVKYQIWDSGEQYASYFVGDNEELNTCDEVLAIFRKRFPEFE